MSLKKLRLGTRRSALALVQTKTVIAALQQAHPGLECETVEVVTSGDKKQNDVSALRDKKEWIIELESELKAGRIDLAVHSGKDVPIDLLDGTAVSSALTRESPFDCYVLRSSEEEPDSSAPLPFLGLGAVVGTASARRGAQLLALRQDLDIQPLRGNVPTRLKKLRESDTLDAIVLADAGLRRLGLAEESSGVFSSSELLPAVNQGILVLQYMKSKTDVATKVSALIDDDTQLSFLVERKLIELLSADCSSCVGVFSEIDSKGKLLLQAAVYSSDGTEKIAVTESAEPKAWQSLVAGVAEELLRRGAKALLAGN